MRAFIAMTKKEFLESIRTYKLFIIVAVFLLFGMLNPITAKIMPKLLSSFMPEGMTITLGEPHTIDSWIQFYKNMSTQLILFVIVYSGIVPNELTKGTLINMLTKGLPRKSVILSKFTATISIWTVSYLICFVITLVYTMYLLPGELPNIIFAACCMWLFGVLEISMMLLGGALSGSIYGSLLLAGGFGSRISEESQFKPKPMIEICGMPILWHIMKEYAYYGYNEFIICAGYKQEYIKEWFANYFLYNSDVSFNFRNGKNEITVHHSNLEPWKVTIVDTGYNTLTGGRIKRIKEYVNNETFMMTYGDGVCDVDINKLVAFHKKHGKIATLTAVIQAQDKGVLNIDENNSIRSFREKNINDGVPINAGYMVLEPRVFDYIEGDQTIFEKEPLNKLATEGELMSYTHKGFWQCMDNIREKNLLEQLLIDGVAPWKKWEREIPIIK